MLQELLINIKRGNWSGCTEDHAPVCTLKRSEATVLEPGPASVHVLLGCYYCAGSAQLKVQPCDCPVGLAANRQLLMRKNKPSNGAFSPLGIGTAYVLLVLAMLLRRYVTHSNELRSIVGSTQPLLRRNQLTSSLASPNIDACFLSRPRTDDLADIEPELSNGIPIPDADDRAATRIELLSVVSQGFLALDWMGARPYFCIL